MIQPISDEDFRKLTNFIKAQYGITLQQKRQLVTSRLSSMLTEQGYTSFSEFVAQLLKERDPQKIEQVLNRLTTNYTFFMRETEHFDFFTKVILPELVRKYQSKKSLAIWSAGCSSGEEPYNLSMYIKDYLGMQASQWDTRILATDISQKALAKAKKGVYEVPDTVPESWRKKYFKKIEGSRYAVSPEIRNNVIFQTFNLMEGRGMCRIHLIGAEHTAWCDHPDGELPFLHFVYLCRRCLRSQQNISRDIERILFILRRMIRRNIQRLKIIVVLLHFRTFDHFISHANEDSLHLFQCNGARMSVSNVILSGRQRNIDDFRLHLRLSDCLLHLPDRFFQNLLNLCSCLIDKLPHLGTLFRQHILHTFQHSRQFPLLTQEIDSYFIQLLQRVAGFDLPQRFCLDLLQLLSHHYSPLPK